MLILLEVSINYNLWMYNVKKKKQLRGFGLPIIFLRVFFYFLERVTTVCKASGNLKNNISNLVIFV